MPPLRRPHFDGGSRADSSGQECARPAAEWIWCDDFEQDRSASYFEVHHAGRSFTRELEVGVSQSAGMRARFAAGQANAGALRLNDPGRSNGRFVLWVNGVEDARLDTVNWLGMYSAFGVNAVFLENYWNGGAPREQTRYFDNLVVSTARIGCGPAD